MIQDMFTNFQLGEKYNLILPFWRFSEQYETDVLSIILCDF